MRVDSGFRPRRHQKHAHRLREGRRFNVLVWHRRAGKTVFAVMELVLAALACERERGRFGYIAPFLKQAKDIAWDYLVAYTREIPGVSVNRSEFSVVLPNGARIQLYGADNPDSIRGGYFDGVVLDEVADMRPQVWGEIIRPMLSDRNGWGLFIGTPKGINLFSERYHEAAMGTDPEWGADLLRARDSGVFTEEEIASAKRSMTPAQYAQEYDCDFAAAVDNALIPLDAVLEAQARMLEEAAYHYAPRVLGIDVARYGDDRSVFQPRQGLMSMQPRVLAQMDLMTLAGHAASYIDKWKPDAVFIDQGGMGAGVIDRMRQLGHDVIGVDFGGKAMDPRFENKRAEMWWLMADWIKSGGCLPKIQDLTQELTAPTYTYANARGRLQLESKDDMRKRGLRSPDVADALALTFAMPVPIRTAMDRAQGNRRTALHDWDPYAGA